MSLNKNVFSAAVLAAVSMAGAQAATLDLSGLIGGANLYTVGNFSAPYSDVEGAMLVGGNLTIQSYDINKNNVDAFKVGGNGYALVVGGDLNYKYGKIENGAYYVGGTTSLTGIGTETATVSTTSPLSFSSVTAALKADSKALGKLSETGTSNIVNSVATLTGTGSGVQVFTLSNSELSGISNFKISNVTAGSTIVVNVSGDSASFRQNGVGLGAFSDYNVVYNFYQASNLSVTGVGLYGTLLAPFASVTGAYGQINGNVIVGDWNSPVQINSTHYFTATSIPTLAVPEPSTYAMLLGGLGLVGLLSRRRQSPRI